MKDAYYLSRAYVEFGPFPSVELLGFHDRGLLKSYDYISGAGIHGAWIPATDWVTAQKTPSKAVPVKKAPAAAKVKAEAPPAKAAPASVKKVAKVAVKKAKTPPAK